MKKIMFMAVSMLVIFNAEVCLAATGKPGLTAGAIKNGAFPLPRLSEGYDMIEFKQGHYKKGDVEADIDTIALGTLDGKPAAVGCVSWNTGGTGVFEVLALYRLVAGSPQCIGWFDLEDRATVNSVAIAHNHVLLDWIKHGPNDPAPFPTVHEVKKLDAKQFEAVQ